jgi:hypothetical protein
VYPPLFVRIKDDPDVQVDFGSDPVRVFPFAQIGHPAPERPYAVWQVISGLPQNYINEVPDIDSFSIQVDVYGDSIPTTRTAAKSLLEAIEPYAHVTGYNGETRESGTGFYRYSFDVTWWVDRDAAETDSIGDSNLVDSIGDSNIIDLLALETDSVGDSNFDSNIFDATLGLEGAFDGSDLGMQL